MPLRKLDGVFSHFEKKYENKMTVCDCRVFLGNSTHEHLVGEYLICNSANTPHVCNLEKSCCSFCRKFYMLKVSTNFRDEIVHLANIDSALHLEVGLSSKKVLQSYFEFVRYITEYFSDEKYLLWNYISLVFLSTTIFLSLKDFSAVNILFLY